ncbi:hypothetical protein GCM10011405_38590 [Rufibacter glacialis]|nr:hypothetical protein GCM10011405_38590 [Rufibacter glacialis]
MHVLWPILYGVCAGKGKMTSEAESLLIFLKEELLNKAVIRYNKIYILNNKQY